MMLAWGVACSLVAFSIGKARADIVWQGPQNITGDLDVSTLGDLVKAWGQASSTVNGVAFTTVNPGITGSQSGGSNFGVGSNIFNNLSMPYKTLLDSASYNAFGTGNMSIDLSALTVGRVYEFQAFVNDSRNNAEGVGGNRNRWNVFDSGAGSAQSGSVFQPYRPGTNNIGQYVKGTFTANSNTQLVRILGNAEFGPATSLINAYQVRDITAVPEPSSILLLSSVAGLGGMFLRKRHGKKDKGVSSLPS
jgi:hypothetical protein